MEAIQSARTAPDSPAQKLSYSIPEAAALVGISRAGIYRAIGRKELAARKCGNRTLVLADELIRFLHSTPILESSSAEARAA